MKEMLESLTETIKERFKSPFFGTLILAWIFFNWRIILFLALSNDPIGARIQAAEANYLNFWNGFAYPFLTTMAYLIIPGYIMQIVEKVNTLSVKSRKDIRYNILKHDYDLRMKQAKWDNDLEDAKANFRELKDLNDKIALLTNQLNERDKFIENQKNEINFIQIDKKYPPSLFPESGVLLRQKIHQVLVRLSEDSLDDLVQLLLFRISEKEFTDDEIAKNAKHLALMAELGLLNLSKGRFTITEFGQDYLRYVLTVKNNLKKNS